MPNILVRNLEPETVERLKQRARRNKRSLQAETKEILEEAAARPAADFEKSVQRITDFRRTLQQRNKGLLASDSTDLVREDRERDAIRD